MLLTLLVQNLGQRSPGVNQRYQYGTHEAAVLSQQLVSSVIAPPTTLDQSPFVLALQGLPQEYREQFWSFVYAPVQVPVAVAAVPIAITASLPETWPGITLNYSFVFVPQTAPAPTQPAAPVFAFNFPDQWPLADVNFSAFYQPQPAPAPPPVITPPPPPGAGGPGKLSGKRRKNDSGPYMRDGQVFGEEYAVSPQAGPQAPARTRDARGRFIPGVRVKMEMRTRDGDNRSAWSVLLDTTFTDLDD